MFYKLITWDIDDSDAESGPIGSYEEIWVVCRANTKQEAKILLDVFNTTLASQHISQAEIVEATEDEYLEFLQELISIT